MNSIKINLSKTEDDLFGQSKWWGAPDLTVDWEYPDMPDDEGEPSQLTFVCQILCAD